MFYPRDFTYHSDELQFNPNKHTSNLTRFQSAKKRLHTLHTTTIKPPPPLSLPRLTLDNVHRSPHQHTTISADAKLHSNANLTKKLITQCTKYCTNSSVHGVKYLVDANLNWFER